MLDKEIIIRRLAIIKYLYNIGVQQSYQVDTIAGFSILSFHDCAEMFLLLAAENRNIKTEKIDFMGFWDKMEDLTLRESMRTLKERRKGIKHKCLFPSKSDIEISRVTIANFLKENSPIQFGVEFDEIRLSSLIANDETRQQIETAENNLNKNELFGCLRSCKIGFNALLHNYETSKSTPPFFYDALKIGEKIGDDYRKLVGSDSRCGERWFRQVTESVNALRETLKMTALGIDFKRYSYFNAITPHVIAYCKVGSYGVDYESEDKSYFEKKHILRKEDCQFCIDFVIDCALKLQEFDFNFENVMKKNEILL